MVIRFMSLSNGMMKEALALLAMKTMFKMLSFISASFLTALGDRCKVTN